jgi:hypothetical protein
MHPASLLFTINVPVAIPAYGNYSNWMLVRGIHTSAAIFPTWPVTETIYGLWVNDPAVKTGLKENTYKTASEFTTTYYKPTNVAGDNPLYINKYIAITEPPAKEVPPAKIASAQKYVLDNDIAGFRETKTTGITTDPFAIGAVNALNDLAKIDPTIPTTVTAVNDFAVNGINGQIYHLITFAQNPKIVADGDIMQIIPRTLWGANTVAAVIINPDGTLAEISIPSTSVKFFEESQTTMNSNIIKAIAKAGYPKPPSNAVIIGSYNQNSQGKFHVIYSGTISYNNNNIGFTVQPNGTIGVRKSN